MQEALLHFFELCIALQGRYKGGRSKRKGWRFAAANARGCRVYLYIAM